MIKNIPLSTRKVVVFSIIAIVVIGLAIVAFLPSGSKSLNLSAALSELVGTVEVRNNTQAPYAQVNNGFKLKSTMQLQTKIESRVRLDLSTGSIVRLGQSTIFSLLSQAPATQGGLVSIGLQLGEAWIILKGGSLDVTTPAGLASVRGSYMYVRVDPASITVSCLEGNCGFKNAAGSVNMTSGQKITWPNANNTLSIEKMDQADVQYWLDNSPEAGTVVPQISTFLASSTSAASSTPVLSTTPAASSTPVAPLTSALSSTPVAPLTSALSSTPAGVSVLQASSTSSSPSVNTTGTATIIPNPINAQNFFYSTTTLTPVPNEKNANPTAKKKANTNTPQPTATRVAPTDENTRVPQPTRTRVAPTDEDTRVPQPTRTHVAPTDEDTRVPQATRTHVAPTDEDKDDHRATHTPRDPTAGKASTFQFSSLFAAVGQLFGLW